MHENVYIGCAAHAPKYWDSKLVHFMNSRGIGKCMWGTDYPILLPKDSLAQVDDLDLKDEAKEALLWKTAEKVFGI